MSAVARILEAFASQPSQVPARQAAAQALREHSLPTRQDENWRYANLRALEGVRQFLPDPEPRPARALPALPEPLAGFERLVYVDGRLEPRQSAAALEKLDALGGAATSAALPAFESAGDGRFGLVARMFAPEPLAVRVRGTLALEILRVSSPGAGASYADLDLELDSGARLELIERVIGTVPAAMASEPSPLICNALQLRLGAGSELVHTRLQQASGDVLLYDTLCARQAERTDYRLRQVLAGGASARSTVQVQLLGREACVDVRALAAAQGSQYTDALYTVLHEAPNTRSNLLFRGIASEQAHVACSADVQVSAQARGSRVLQSLRGLIDGKGAEVNLRPRLTINTDDIQAAHGATTGRLDEGLLFYLLSRGLAPQEARSLLKWAFLSEILGAFGTSPLRKVAESAVAARLSDAPAAELLQ